ncbi:CPBP family intramembrane metalloprotease [Candidatus Saccharibacteria bacterium]|nr:CPBP family intramembrane metalloprotease [Candidatus Saccharibacteria bacterium]
MKKAHPVLKKIGQALAWAIWVCAVTILVQFLLARILSWLISISPIHISSALAQLIFALLSYALSIIIILFAPQKIAALLHRKYIKIKAEKLEPNHTLLGLNELPTWTDIGLAPVGLIVYALLASLLTSLFSLLPWFNPNEAQDVGFNNLFVTSDRIFAFIALVVIAPIAEELIFRGFLYQKIKNLFYQKDAKKEAPKKSKSHQKSEIVAIVIATFITSLAFAIMHGQWNVGINVFAMSIVLCMMREITDSIYSGILLHMLKNAIAFYLLYIATMGF